MVESLLTRLLAGQRQALAKALTLVESERPADAPMAESLLIGAYPHSGNSVRIGISGIPGVGKSTLIEALGIELLSAGAKVAVLAVDPSSALSGGSVLGDKTRMERLSVAEHAFIRPSPARGYLGGVARRTREAITLCEAAGYDTVIIETVGIGQSEALVASMVDVFVLLQMPHTGDELQTFKKGALELADIVVITKADGLTLAAAKLAAAEHKAAAMLYGRGGAKGVPVLLVSAITGDGITDLAAAIRTRSSDLRSSGTFIAKREGQRAQWFEDELKAGLFPLLMAKPWFKERYQQALRKIQEMELLPRAAVRELFSSLWDSTKGNL